MYVYIYIYIFASTYMICYPSPRLTFFCMVDMSLSFFPLLCSLSHVLCFCSGVVWMCGPRHS